LELIEGFSQAALFGATINAPGGFQFYRGKPGGYLRFCRGEKLFQQADIDAGPGGGIADRPFIQMLLQLSIYFRIGIQNILLKK
jgi:hypothetical protein